MKRAVLYARVSTDAQHKEGAIQSQVFELKKQIAAAGDVPVKEYIDGGTAARYWIRGRTSLRSSLSAGRPSSRSRTCARGDSTA
jgi:DNA invertase Pin-like site-specific DNA recombinase